MVTRQSECVVWRRTTHGWGVERERKPHGRAAAAHFETTRPNTEPMAMGLILRSEGESPSLRSAISLPPKIHGRHAGGMPPLQAKRTRAMMERAPRPATKESHASSESRGKSIGGPASPSI